MENLVSIADFRSVFGGKSVFVTGHTGFKGSWLCACLKQAGATIMGYSLKPEYKNGLYDILKSDMVTSETISDIRDRERLTKEIVEFKPDFIFHLAAQPLVLKSYQEPAETFDINVTGTANILEAVKELDNKCVCVVITTDKVYENREENILYNETDPLGGYDPYSTSKACTELVVNSFRKSFFNPYNFHLHQKALATARAGNVIGGGDWSSNRIIPDIVRCLQDNKPVLVRNPSSVRPWQHVLEPVRGYMQLAALLDNEPAKYSKAYNFGPNPDDHLSVEELVKIAIDCWGNGTWQNISPQNQPHEAGLLKLNIERARNELGWFPKLAAEVGIEWTIQWFKQKEREKKNFTYQQINDYFAL